MLMAKIPQQRGNARRYGSSFTNFWQIRSHTQSVTNRQRLCTILHIESRTMSTSSQWNDKTACWQIYFGSTLSGAVYTDDEVNNRIAKASAAYVEISRIEEVSGCINSWKSIKLQYYSLIKTVYACDTWTVYQHHAKRLNHIHTSCFR